MGNTEITQICTYCVYSTVAELQCTCIFTSECIPNISIYVHGQKTIGLKLSVHQIFPFMSTTRTIGCHALSECNIIHSVQLTFEHMQNRCTCLYYCLLQLPPDKISQAPLTREQICEVSGVKIRTHTSPAYTYMQRVEGVIMVSSLEGLIPITPTQFQCTRGFIALLSSCQCL